MEGALEAHPRNLTLGPIIRLQQIPTTADSGAAWTAIFWVKDNHFSIESVPLLNDKKPFDR